MPVVGISVTLNLHLREQILDRLELLLCKGDIDRANILDCTLRRA